jgi:hypothetical protein
LPLFASNAMTSTLSIAVPSEPRTVAAIMPCSISFATDPSAGVSSLSR